MNDDLESVGYIMVYLLTGSLPWSGKSTHFNAVRIKKVSQLIDDEADFLRFIGQRDPQNLCVKVDGNLLLLLLKQVRYNS